jgi:hypothetical protein
VVSRSVAQLITQGDGMAEADVPVTAHEFLGKVIQVMRRGNAIRHASQPGLRTRLTAVLFRRSAIAGRLFTRLQALRGRAGQ